MKKEIIICLILMIQVSLFAGDFEEDENWKKQNPFAAHFLSYEEMLLNKTYIRDFTPTDPPTGEVRQTSEFEQMEGVLVVYPLGIPYSLVAEISQDVIVYTIVTSDSQTQCHNNYQNNGVNMGNCQFINAPTNTHWVRDYGPWFIANDNEIAIVDFPYNRPRPLDDEIPVIVADYFGIDLYGMDIEHTGGNYMCDGNYVGASTDLVYDENLNLTPAQIDQLVQDFLGIDTYHVTIDPLDEYIKHIDCWGKFLDVDKVMIGQVPETDYRYEDFEFVADYFAEQTSAWGNNYEVYRVYTPGGYYQATPYTNSLIVNSKVFVPITGSQWDDEAIASYEEAMPGYEIFGIYYTDWVDTDALHCRTKGTADRGMLFVKHFPILGNAPVQEEYEILADVIPYSGEAIYPDSMKVYYKVNGGDFISLNMTYEGGDTYKAIIPGQALGSEIAYYIHAADESGRSMNHPYIGAPDPHTFFVGMPLYPDIVVDPLQLNLNCYVGGSVSGEFTISNIGNADLEYSITFSTAIPEEVSYDVPDSPSGSSYNYNTYTELGWTDFQISDIGEIAELQVEYTWDTDSYPTEGSFWMESPAGTTGMIATGQTDGTYQIDLDDFIGEQIEGNWKIWIEDTWGDGGHQATNIDLNFTILIEQEQWLIVNSVSGTIGSGMSVTAGLVCSGVQLEPGIYEGSIFIHSNDPDEPIVIVSVILTVEENVDSDNDCSPQITELLGNYPNPFNPETTITFFTAEGAENAEIVIYNLKGQKVRNLECGESLSTTTDRVGYSITWNGKDDNNQPVGSGIYFYQLKVDDKFISAKKMILMK